MRYCVIVMMVWEEESAGLSMMFCVLLGSVGV